jgi:hypothetical protein
MFMRTLKSQEANENEWMSAKTKGREIKLNDIVRASIQNILETSMPV